MRRKPWATFKRTHADKFFGCVDAEGNWFDSSVTFTIAVHWCACALGEMDSTEEEELALINKHNYSIIHSDLLKVMYEKGLIK